MVQRYLSHGKADLDTAGRRGQRSSKTNRVDIGAYAVEMMLGQPDRIKAKLLGQLGLRDSFVDDASVQRRISALGKQEVAELHMCSCSISLTERRMYHVRPPTALSTRDVCLGGRHS